MEYVATVVVVFSLLLSVVGIYQGIEWYIRPPYAAAFKPKVAPHIVAFIMAAFFFTFGFIEIIPSSLFTTLIRHLLPFIGAAILIAMGVDYVRYQRFLHLTQSEAVPAPPEPVEPPKPVIPENLRTQHHWVVAPPGWGKSQLFQSMILDDLETNAAIVVIDSQNDLINNLARRIPYNRLILIDPATCPPAFNVFAGTTANLTSRVALLTYALSAIGAEMTSKQQGMFDYLCRYMLSKPSTMGDFLEALQNPASIAGLADMGPVERAFYTEYANPKGEYRDSRGEVSRRLLALLADKTLQTMLMADEMSIDISKALDSGKVILINTAKAYMGQRQAMLFGRLWIAQILNAVMQREGTRRRTYMYIDEYADYASEDPIMLDLFRQTRKFELGMIVAHQTLSDLPTKLRDVMLGTTAIKMCGGVSAADVGVLAKQMRVDTSYLDRVKRGTFAAHFRDIGFREYPVEFGRLEKVPPLQNLKQIQAEMRELYGPKSRQPETPSRSPSPEPVSPKNPESGPQNRGREGKSFMTDE